jgi:hypothetical protein
MSCGWSGKRRSRSAGRPAAQSKEGAGRGTHLQPPFFSMVLWHLVHSLVLALIQLDVSESSAHFCRQSLAILQTTGRWSVGSPQPKQNVWPQVQTTVGMMVVSCLAGACLHSIANSPAGRKGCQCRKAGRSRAISGQEGQTHTLGRGTSGGRGCRRRRSG